VEWVGDKELVTYLEENASISPLTDRLGGLGWFKESEVENINKKLANFYYLSFPFLLLERKRQTIERIQYFETLLITTRAGFLGKFYRDHMNHMVRVSLIASMIYIKLTKELGIPLQQCDPNTLLISSLFHDIGYPIQEAKVIFEGISAGLESLYQSMEISSPYLESRLTSKYADETFKRLAAVNARERLTSLTEDEMYKLLNNEFYSKDNPSMGFDHGVISAVEMSFIGNKYPILLAKSIEQGAYDKALLAIALHNLPSVQVDLNAFPELYILILADELQEWNRPIFLKPDETTVVMSKIGIEAKKDKIPSLTFHLDYGNRVKGFDALRQLGSKGGAISRLKADSLKLNLLMDVVYPYSDDEIFKLEFRCEEKSNWFIDGLDSIKWIEEKLQMSQSEEYADLRTHMLLLLDLWSEDEAVLKKLLEMAGLALSTRCLCNPDDVTLCNIIVKLRLNELRNNCKEGLRDILLIIWQLNQEVYQKARHDTYRMKYQDLEEDEDFTLPEVGPASEDEIDEAERKTHGCGDSGRYRYHIDHLRWSKNALREIQDALDSIK